MDEELKQKIDNELAGLRGNEHSTNVVDDEVIEWEPVNIPVAEEDAADDEVIEWEPVNVPSYTTLDADTNKVYSVPATMDETDTRFAIHTQAEKIGKDNFLGKVLLFGGQLALDYVKGKAKEAVGEAKQAPKSAAAGALDIGASIARGETDLLFDYFRRKERAEKGKNKGSSSMPRLGLAELFLPDDVVEAGRAADEAAYIADEIKGRAEPRISQEMAENPVSLMYGGEFDRPVSDEEFDAAQKNAQELNQKAVALYEKWRQHNVETINKISLGLMPEEMRGKKDFQNVMYGIGNSATSIAASMAITLATKNPYVASAMISKAYFDSSKSEAFQEALGRGEDFDTADLHSDILGAFDGVLEGTGDFIMMGIAKVGTAPASKVLKNAFVGSVEKILNNRAVAAPVKTAVKNVARQSSVFKAAAKGFLTEGPFEETLQNVLGDEYRNDIGWQDKSQADIWADASFAGFVGGITGAGFGAGGTILYNRRMRNWNRQIKDQVKAYNPGIDDQTAQTTADLLQETFLQEGAPAIDTLDQLLNKEKDPDTMPEGIDARSISEVSRQVMKERFGVTDEQIDQWAKIVAPMIDARNQYNEVYQNFYEQLTAAGRPNAEADADARIIAARAVTLAVNEGKSAADILERWQLRIEDGEQGSAVYLAEREGNGNFEQAMYKSKLDTLENFVDDIFNNPEDTSARYFANLSNSGVNFDIPRDTVLHDKKHSLTAKEWTEVASNIDNIESAALSSKKRFDGQSVLMKVATPNGKYGVVFEHMKSGRNIVTTAFKDTDANIDNWIKNNSARAMQTASTTQKGLLSSRSMSDIISVLDNNVNDTLYQLPQKAYGVDGKADINTPEFKRWFGDSKAVDEKGRPLVVYHGTNAEFDTFKGKYHFFSDSENVSAGYGSQNPMPVYLSMKKPLIVDAYGQSFGEIYNAEGYKKAYKDLTEDDYKKIAKAYDLSVNEAKELFPENEDGIINLARAYGKKPRSTNEWAEYAKKNGYDGVIIKDVNDTADISNIRSTDYIVFNPNQIKSVNNRGSFSRTDDNIYYQTGAEFGWPDYQEIEASEHYAAVKQAADNVLQMIEPDVDFADKTMSINRNGEVSSYVKGQTKAGDPFTIRISDHPTVHDYNNISVSYRRDIAVIRDMWKRFLDSPRLAAERKQQQEAARKEYIAKNLPKEYISYYRQYGLKALKKAVNEGQLPPFKFTFNNEQQKIYGRLGISWKDVENFIKENGETYYQTGEKAVGRRVYSVFDLKVGDHTVIGDVQEIDNENRTIKINDRIYSMLLLDTQIQYKGLVVNDALVGNAEENISETEQVEKIKKAEENRSAVEEQKRNNREYNQKAKGYFGITNNLDVGGYILTDGDVLDLSGRKFGSDGKSRSIDHREISDAFEDYGVSMEDFINSGNIRYMPESNSILMSDVPTSEQYKVIEKIINRADGEVRVELMNDANNWGSDKDFSREYPAGTTLTKIKRDINAFYRGAGVRDIMQFLQKGTAAGQSRQNRMIYRVMGQYEPAKKLITLFQGKDTTTLCHELLHHYLPIYLNVLEKAGRFDKLEGLYRELGVSRMADMRREEWEKLVDLGTSYIFYNQAPNEASKSIFERAKQWMMDAYNTVKKFVKPSPEVTKFFDGLFARDASTLPDVSDLKGRTAELAKILQGAKNGQELTVNGLSLRDISRLRQALYARVPAAGKTLADEIRSAGGIDTESELARQLGYDSKKGTEGGFWNYKGTIKDESQLIDFLKANGYLEETTENTYEKTSSVWDKVQQLINRRNDTYNEKEQSRQMARDSALAAGQVVSEILNQHYIGDVKKLEEDLRAATKMLADRGAAAVDKATLDYLTFSLKQMEKDYQRLLYQKKEERYNYQEKLTKFIKDLPLDYNHKSKFMDKIRMVKDEKSFNKYLKETKERAEKYIEQEQRRMLSDLIQSEVKSSRPRKVMAQKYDYENNVLFKDLRDYNKMTQSEAAAKLEKLDKDEESVDNPGSRGYLLRRMFLEYKANGMDSSSELMRQLYEMIGEAKQLGRESKEESEFEKSFEREQDRQQIIDKLAASKADKNKWTTMATNVYRRGITNLYSMLNSIAGKEIADKYEMETVIDRKEQKEWKHLKKTSAKAEVIYKVKSYGDLLNVMADKGQEVAVLYRRKKDDTQEAQTESYNENFKYDVSVLDIIDIYNAIKNKKTRQDYEEAYGAEQINRLISLLSPEDRAFGDMLMEDVNSRFAELNKVYVRVYGMDLKKVENYWMGSAEHVEPVDIVEDFRQQATTPGFFKERKNGKVTPVAKNAWIKYQKHISQSYYMTDVAEKYKQLADIFKSKRIENQIENHFGSGVYQTLRKQIENIGLNAQSPRLDDVSGYFQKLLNNWVGAKVSVNPVVFVGQLTSFTNYAEGVNLSAFIKNIGYALAHPIEVKDFMMKYNGDFLQHRYEAGFNEAMSRFIEGAKETNGKKFGLSAKAKFNYSNALSSFVRIGDLGAIIYGGYGQFKTLLDSGMSVEEARRKFEFSTLRSQQSGNAASISDWQQQRGFPRTYLAFKNASLQYTRKIADTVIMLQNGDISREEAAKVLTNYLLIQPAFWVIAKNIAKSLLGLGDDDDEFDDGVLEQLLANPIDGVPFVSDMVRYAYREAAGEKNYSLFSTPLLDDVEKSFRKIGKEDKDFYDFADIVTPFIEMLTSAPAGTAKRYMKIYNEKWGE